MASFLPLLLLHCGPVRGPLNSYLQQHVLSWLDLQVSCSPHNTCLSLSLPGAFLTSISVWQSNPARLESWGMDGSVLAPQHRAMYAQHLAATHPPPGSHDEEIEV